MPIDLSYNNIESFKYGPKYIGGSFFITNNKIKSLEFAPEIIKESLVVNHLGLKSEASWLGLSIKVI